MMDWEVSKSIENKTARNSYQAAIEDLSRGVHSKKGSMEWEAIEHLENFSMDLIAIEKLSRMR